MCLLLEAMTYKFLLRIDPRHQVSVPNVPECARMCLNVLLFFARMCLLL